MNTKFRRSIEKTLALCALAMAHHAVACEPSINVSEAGGIVDGKLIAPTSTGECLKTDVRIDENQGEYRSRTTTINSDGSVNPQGKDDRLLLDKEQMRVDRKDRGYGQFSGEWPDDEYTRRIPKPDMVLYFAFVNKKDHSFGALFKKNTEGGNRNVAKMKAYVEKLKSRGFTINAKSREDESFGGLYVYRAKDSTGYLVHFFCTMDAACGVNLYDPVGVQKREEREARGSSQTKQKSRSASNK